VEKVWGSKDSYLLTDWTMLRFQPGHFLLQPLYLLSLWTHTCTKIMKFTSQMFTIKHRNVSRRRQ